jgi:fructose-1,6-bisphosphatase/inositol monophosphatase family enzyme
VRLEVQRLSLLVKLVKLVRGSRGSCWFDAARVACGEADEAVADHNMRVQLLRQLAQLHQLLVRGSWYG